MDEFSAGSIVREHWFSGGSIVREHWFSGGWVLLLSLASRSGFSSSASSEKTAAAPWYIAAAKSPDYPLLLSDIPDPPIMLHARENLQALDAQPTIAIIGTREPSRYGLRLGRWFSVVMADGRLAILINAYGRQAQRQ